MAVAREALKRIAEGHSMFSVDEDEGTWKVYTRKPVLVFEDDAQIPPDFVERLEEWMCQLPDDWDMLLLGWWDRGGSMRAGHRAPLLRRGNKKVDMGGSD